MRKILFVLAIVLSLLDASTATATGTLNQGVETGLTKNEEARTTSTASDSVVGEISDSHCRFKHMEGMESDANCVLHCLENKAKPVLADRAKGVVYTLDEEGQKLARKFAGQPVRVTGHVMETMIHVEKIEAAQ